MGLFSRIKKSVKKRLGREEASTQRSNDSRLPAEPDADGFLAVAFSEQLKQGRGSTFRYRETNVAVFRLESGLFAIDDACTHEDGPLGEGDIDGLVVTCPYHDWRFDVSSGDCLSHENRHVACYEVKEHDGCIWVGKQSRKGSADRGGLHDDGLNSPQIKI